MKIRQNYFFLIFFFIFCRYFLKNIVHLINLKNEMQSILNKYNENGPSLFLHYFFSLFYSLNYCIQQNYNNSNCLKIYEENIN
jgi:hypothetical protein